MAKFFAPKGKFLKIGRIKFNNHLYTTSREDEADIIRKSSAFGISIFELPDGMNPADLIKDANAMLGPITTKNFEARPHKNLENFFKSKQLEILDTESRMQANRDSPMLKPTSLANYSKATLVKLCEDFFVEYEESDTRKALIRRLMEFSGHSEG